MIDRIKKTVETYLSTDNRGNFTPEDYDTILHNIVNDRYEQLLFEVNKAINRQNRGLFNGGLENVPDRIREKLQHYLVDDSVLTYITDRFSLPDDIRYFDVVKYNDEEIEMAKNNREFNILKKDKPFY